MSFLIRGTSSPGPPYTLSREPLRRLAPFAWLASLRSLAPSSRCTHVGDRRQPCQMSFLIRGTSSPGPPSTLSREPLRRLAPFAWLASLRSLAPSSRCTHVGDRRQPCQMSFLIRGTSSPGPPYTLSREPLRRLAPFAWLASLRSLAPSSRCMHVGDRRQPCQMSFLIRGTSSPGPPYTLSREPLRRLAPFAWLAPLARALFSVHACGR